MFWPISLIYYRKERQFLTAAKQIVALIERNKIDEAEQMADAELKHSFAQLMPYAEREIFKTMIMIDEGLLDLLRSKDLGKEYTSTIDGAKWEIKSHGSSLTEIKDTIENAQREII